MSCCDPGDSIPPVCVPSLRTGSADLGAEQLEHLQEDVATIKKNYRRANTNQSNVR